MYLYAQFMKFIQPGAVHVESAGQGSRTFGHAAFLDPDGRRVLVVANAGAQRAPFLVRSGGGQFAADLPARSVATFCWTAGPR